MLVVVTAASGVCVAAAVELATGVEDGVRMGVQVLLGTGVVVASLMVRVGIILLSSTRVGAHPPSVTNRSTPHAIRKIDFSMLRGKMGPALLLANCVLLISTPLLYGLLIRVSIAPLFNFVN